MEYCDINDPPEGIKGIVIATAGAPTLLRFMSQLKPEIEKRTLTVSLVGEEKDYIQLS